MTQRRCLCVMAAAVALCAAVCLLTPGCKRKGPAPRTVEPGQATQQAKVKCPECGSVFEIGKARPVRPNAPQVACPDCGKVVVPTKPGE